jgi:benzylsuccinate CoA-transferase BbsF subunit
VYLDQSQIEASLHYMTPAILDHQLNGTSWDRLGNDDPDLFPHGVYRSAGDDEWVAVAVRHEADWAALCRVIGHPEWGDDAALTTVDGRRSRGDEIDAAIETWTSTRPAGEAEALFQSAGVPAHAVAHAGRADDPQLEHLRHLVTVPHAGHGERVVERTRIDLTRTPPAPGHVPALGQHTVQVLRDILGYSEDRVAQLRAVGALGGEPNRS